MNLKKFSAHLLRAEEETESDMIKKVSLITATAFLLGSTSAIAQNVQEQIVQKLRSEGYTQIEISRSFFGRLRIEAHKDNFERELVVNPRTGVILRDHLELDEEDHKANNSDETDPKKDEDDDRDEEDDREDEDDRDEEDDRDDEDDRDEDDDRDEEDGDDDDEES